MKKIMFLAVVAAVITTSCKKGFTKKEEASFKVNGTEYKVDEDGMGGGYWNGSSTLLEVDIFGGQNQTLRPTIVVDLTKLNQVVQIDSLEDGFNYTHINSTLYRPKRGTWEITSHKEGNPATRHTEGKFEMVVFDPVNPTDTLTITDGYFYMNNY